MTHRDGFPRLSASSAWRGDAGHRKPCAPSQSYGPSENPRPQAWGKPPFRSRGRTAGGRRKALPMSRIARGFPPTRPLARRIACPISMGHYQRSLVLRPGVPARDADSDLILGADRPQKKADSPDGSKLPCREPKVARASRVISNKT